VSEDLSRVAVIAVGSATATYAREVAGDTSHSAITITRSSDIDDVVTQVADQFAASDASSRLPAVLLISDTKEADTVVAVIRALRAARLPMRPRVWPAFVSGDVSHLDNFDKALDELGSSASDVVVIATGSGGTAATSTALRAWLHVKVPAPPSVLAELPDKSGHTCRYVAVGSITVSEATSPDITDTQADEPDVAAITVAVAKDLRA
jgi:hypothetical protein